MSDQLPATHRISPGGFAITVFIGSTVYLGLVHHGWQTLLTFKAVIFLLLGVFFSVLLIGVPFHLLRIRLERLFFSPADVVRPTAARIKQAKTVITLLMALQVVATFYATKFAYHWYFS